MKRRSSLKRSKRSNLPKRPKSKNQLLEKQLEKQKERKKESPPLLEARKTKEEEVREEDDTEAIEEEAEEEGIEEEVVEKRAMAAKEVTSIGSRDRRLLDHQRTMRMSDSKLLVRNLTTEEEAAEVATITALSEVAHTEVAEIEAATEVAKVAEEAEEVIKAAIEALLAVEINHQLIKTEMPRLITAPQLNEICANMFSCFYLLQ